MAYRRKLKKEEPQIVVAYRDQSQTLRDIARFHKVSPGTIRNILIRHEVSLRMRGRRKKV